MAKPRKKTMANFNQETRAHGTSGDRIPLSLAQQGLGLSGQDVQPIDQSFSCFLIGSTSLLIHCAEILSQQACVICGIISTDRIIRNWAEEHGIPCFETDCDLAAVLGKQTFDFLFGIANGLVLTPEILACPQRGAINYHDSPLPKYAGVHATAWAIMNRENQHGISWHMAEAGIDTGKVLKQYPVQLAGNETSLTLNAKCYEAAVSAFAQLVDELRCGKAKALAQNIDQRTYYSLYQRPPCGGVLFFNQPAAAIDAFVRALTFGEAYPNPLLTPKIFVKDTFFIVERLVELESNSCSPPGTVIAINEAALVVATTSNDVAIQQLCSIDGTPLALVELAARFGLGSGSQLAAPDPQLTRKLTQGVKQACQHELYWVARLNDLQPPQIPYMQLPAADCRSEPAMAAVAVPDAFLANCMSAGQEPAHAVMAAFVVYLSRISDAGSFDLGFLLPPDGSGWPASFFAGTIPVRVEPDFLSAFFEFSAALQNSLAELSERGSYARDIRYRYPELRHAAPHKFTGLPIEIGRVETMEALPEAGNEGLSLIYAQRESKFLLVYQPQSISHENILGMIAQFQTMLHGIAANPQARLSALPLLTAVERQQILIEWNDTARSYPRELCVHQLFEAQVARTPDALALIYGEQQYTYAELNDRANRLAHFLRGLGVIEETLVAICVERSLEMVVALLGVLKAGAAYVPLDPEYPAERLAFMLSDSAAPVVLTQARLLQRLPQSAATRVCLDSDWAQIMQQADFAPSSAVTPHNLAYVIYTSGSTGTPKGVAIEHRSIAEHCQTIIEHYQFSASDRILQFASFSFDASVEEILPPLAVGAVVVLPRHQLKEPEEFDASIRRYGITALLVPPAFFQLWTRLYDAAHLPPESLRLIILGGDALPRAAVMAWRALPPCKAKLVNAYGPTETTIWAMTYTIPDLPDSSIPIGKPHSNTSVYVLDPHLQPVPIGVTGELYIGGIRVGRGYLNRPELTAQRFIPNPFSNPNAPRLYRTGDMARYLPDGNIEFLGRIDHQLKIRGFRVELGEVEAGLRQHPALHDVAVLAREDRAGDKRLVAYVVPVPDTTPTPTALREFLRLKLPDYMLPAAYVILKSLPLTPNGKLDRKALPAPVADSSARSQKFVAPGSTVEQNLCDLWAEVLGVEQISIRDNFFELGGHSLSGTQLVSKINRTYCVRMSLLNLFENPTIEAQSKEIDRMQCAALFAASNAAPLSRANSPLPDTLSIPLSFAQQAFWLADQLEPGNAAHNIAHEIRLDGPLDAELLARCLNEIVNRHAVLRTRFIQHDDAVGQTVTPALAIELAAIDLTNCLPALREQTLQRKIAEASDTGFDLQLGPLLRATLFKLSQQEHVLLLVIHHIVSDGWSTGVFNRELEALYSAYGKGLPSPLPVLPVQYADFARWQRQWLQGEVLENLLAYWRGKLANVSRLKLPADRHSPARMDYRISYQELHLPQELSAALKQLATHEACTLFMVLTAAFKLLLHRHSGQEDMLVGAPIAGRRNHDEYKGLIGAFINTIILRTDLSGDPTFSEMLQREREAALEAYRHSDLPFDKLVEELRPERKAGLNPYLDVLINFWEESWSALKLEGMTACNVRSVEQQSSFALSLSVVGRPQGLRLLVRYQLALFSDEHIRNLLDQFRYLLEQVCEKPQQRIASFLLLTPAARRLLPDPTAQIPEPAVELVPACVSGWAHSAPQQIAIQQGERTWTYAVLSACSRAQAQHLLELGVQAGDVVAVGGTRSFGLISAMLAVLSSGGVLLTLDGNLPLARQRVMLSEARAKFMIRVGDGGEEANSPDALPQLDVDAASGVVLNPPKNPPDAAPLPQLAPDAAAYVFFTSGSAGLPKGILGTRKGMAHMIAWQRATFSISARDRCAQLIHLSFDAVLRDIFLPLTSGATLCLPENNVETGAEILAWLARAKITLLHSVPSLAQSWLDDCPPGISLPELRWMFFSGEPLNGALAQRWQEHTDTCRYVNLYGPTETALIKSYYILPEEVSQITQPLGQALPDTQILVLGARGKMCGLGEPGEIVIRTPFGTLGYLNPTKEERKGFAMNPFRNDEHDRVYFTGDRGYYAADGLLHILGRLDHQVKINGVRIEPDEVSAVLAQSEAVKSCVVVGGRSPQGKDILVAYVVPQRPDTVIGEIRAYLAERLPFAMVPKAYILLGQLPLKPNGKVDRDKLPDWEGELPLSAHNFVAPESHTEKLLAEIWRDILKLEMLGVHDDFFALGGHSLTGMLLISRINQMFYIRMPLHRLFDKSTIAAQSKEIERLQHEALLQDDNLEALLREVESSQAQHD